MLRFCVLVFLLAVLVVEIVVGMVIAIRDLGDRHDDDHWDRLI